MFAKPVCIRYVDYRRNNPRMPCIYSNIIRWIPNAWGSPYTLGDIPGTTERVDYIHLQSTADTK